MVYIFVRECLKGQSSIYGKETSRGALVQKSLCRIECHVLSHKIMPEDMLGN